MQPESGLLAAYYGLPALSVRDALFHRWARNEPGFRSRDFMCNLNHPNYLGHQCAPCPSPTPNIILNHLGPNQCAAAARARRGGGGSGPGCAALAPASSMRLQFTLLQG